jgi:hypothetical protein
MESSKSLQSGSEEESAKSSHIEDNSSSSVSADGSLPSKTHNNQEADGVTNAQHLHSDDNRNDDDDMDEDKGDDYGGSDDGSVYRRPKSPSFDINPNDEVCKIEHCKFFFLQMITVACILLINNSLKKTHLMLCTTLDNLISSIMKQFHSCQKVKTMP